MLPGEIEASGVGGKMGKCHGDHLKHGSDCKGIQTPKMPSVEVLGIIGHFAQNDGSVGVLLVVLLKIFNDQKKLDVR